MCEHKIGVGRDEGGNVLFHLFGGGRGRDLEGLIMIVEEGAGVKSALVEREPQRVA